MSRDLTPYESTQLSRHGSAGIPLTDTTPIEYVTGVAEFCSLEFAVNPSVLIPRVETEGLVELALECLSEKMGTTNQLNIIDVGTGSGAVIISLAKHLENSPLPVHLLATDISNEALTIAQENAKKLTSLPIQFQIADLLTDIEGSFDLITANLPYIPSEAVKSLDESVLSHEPLLALDGGNNGFDLIRTLVENAPNKLANQGSLILELDPSHKQSFFVEFENNFFITFFNDCFDRHRFARLDLKNKSS